MKLLDITLMLQNFSESSELHLCWSFLVCNFAEKDTVTGVFLWIVQNFKNNFFQIMPGWASVQSSTEISCLIFPFSTCSKWTMKTCSKWAMKTREQWVKSVYTRIYQNGVSGVILMSFLCFELRTNFM